MLKRSSLFAVGADKVLGCPPGLCFAVGGNRGAIGDVDPGDTSCDYWRLRPPSATRGEALREGLAQEAGEP